MDADTGQVRSIITIITLASHYCVLLMANADQASTERPETPPSPSCALPFRRDADFVDRGTLLAQIRKRCAAPASRVALVGLGGVG